MAKVVGLKIQVDGFPVIVKNLKEVDSLIEKLDSDLKGLGVGKIEELTQGTKGFTQAQKRNNDALAETFNQLKQNIRTQGDLNKALKETKAALKNPNLGTEEYKKLEDKLIGLKLIQKQLRDEAKKAQKELELKNLDPTSLKALKATYKDLNSQFENLSKSDRGGEMGKKLQAQLAKLKNVQRQLRNEARQTERELEFKDLEPTSLRGLEITYTKLRNEIKLLDAAGRQSDYGKNLIQQAKETREEIVRLNAEMSDHRANVGNYPEIMQNALGAIGGGGGIAGSLVTGVAAGGTMALIDGAIQGVSELKAFVQDTVNEFRNLNREVFQLTGLEGDAAEGVSSQVKAIADVFGKDTSEVLQAANAEAKQLGVSLEDALGAMEQRFLAGADANGELIDSTKEYAGFIKEAGLSQEEFSNILIQSNKQGIFSDKGIDAIKEGVLRIREMPDATAAAVEALGINADDLKKKIAEEGVGAAIAEVSNKMNEFADDSPVIGQALADIFGGPGEDAGVQYIKSLKDIKSETGDLIDTSNGYIQAQMRQLQVQKEYTAAQQKLASVFGEGGNVLENIGTQIKTELIEILVNLLENLKAIGTNVFDVLQAFGFLQGGTSDLNEVIDFLISVVLNGLVGQIQYVVGAIRVLSSLFTELWLTAKDGVNYALNEMGVNLSGVGDIAKRVFSFFANGGGLQVFIDLIKKAKDAVADLFSKLSGSTGVMGEVLSFFDRVASRAGIEITPRQEEVKFGLSDRVGDFSKRLKEQTEALTKKRDATKEQLDGLGLLEEKLKTLKEQMIKARSENNKPLFDKLKAEAIATQQELKAFKKDLELTETKELAENSLVALEKKVSELNAELKNADPKEYERLAATLSLAEEKAKAAKDALAEIKNKAARGEQKEVQGVEGGARVTSLEVEENPDFERIVNKQKELQIRAVKDVTLSKLEQLEKDREFLQYRLDFAEIEYAKRIELTEQLAAKEKEVEEEKARLKAEQLEQEQLDYEKGLEKAQFALESTSQAFEIIGQFEDARTQRQLDAIDKKYAEEIRQAGDNEEEKAKLEQKRDAEKKKVEKEAFERNKKLAITQAIIGGALAIINIMATNKLGVIGRVIEVALAVATTAAQIATISSQKFAKGGIIKGASHAQGGVKFSHQGQIMELEGGEAVINKRSTAYFRDTLSRINSYNGYGKKFEQGGIIGNIPPPNYQAIGRESLKQQQLVVTLDAKALGKEIATQIKEELEGFEDIPSKIGESTVATTKEITDKIIQNNAKSDRNGNNAAAE